MQGLAIASLIIGIIGFLLSGIFIGIFPCILAITMGAIAASSPKVRKTAITGMVFGFLGLLVSFGVMSLIFGVWNNKDLASYNFYVGNQSGNFEFSFSDTDYEFDDMDSSFDDPYLMEEETESPKEEVTGFFDQQKKTLEQQRQFMEQQRKAFEEQKKIFEEQTKAFEQQMQAFEKEMQDFDQELESRFKMISVAQSRFEQDFQPIEKLEPDEEILNKIENVVLSLDYDPATARKIAEMLLPVYVRMNFRDINDIDAVIHDLERNRRIITSFVFYLGVVDRKHFDLFVLLTDENLGGIMTEVADRFSNLTPEQQYQVHGAFLCNYSSYIGWILLKAKGLTPRAIVTDSFPKKIAQQFRPWWEKLTQNYQLPELEEGEYHAALLLNPSENKYFFVDFVNNFITPTFSLQDDYYQSLSGSYLLSDTSREDIFESFEPTNENHLKAELYNRLGNVHRLLGKKDLAKQSVKRALAIAPGLFIGHMNLARLYIDENQLDAAIQHLEIVTRSNHYYTAIAHILLGEVYFVKEYYDKAIFHLKEYIKLSPLVDEKAYSNLAACYFNKKNFDQSIHFFRKNLEVEPDDAESHLYLGYSLAETGHMQEAKKHFKQALKLFENLQDNRLILQTRQAIKNYFPYSF